jgi:hypothetical protein
MSPGYGDPGLRFQTVTPTHRGTLGRDMEITMAKNAMPAALSIDLSQTAKNIPAVYVLERLHTELDGRAAKGHDDGVRARDNPGSACEMDTWSRRCWFPPRSAAVSPYLEPRHTRRGFFPPQHEEGRRFARRRATVRRPPALFPTFVVARESGSGPQRRFAAAQQDVGNRG